MLLKYQSRSLKRAVSIDLQQYAVQGTVEVLRCYVVLPLCQLPGYS